MVVGGASAQPQNCFYPLVVHKIVKALVQVDVECFRNILAVGLKQFHKVLHGEFTVEVKPFLLHQLHQLFRQFFSKGDVEAPFCRFGRRSRARSREVTRMA